MPRSSVPTTEQLDEWERWLATRPPHVAVVARRLPPWQRYRLKSTGQCAAVLSYSEGGTVVAQCWRDDPPTRVAWFAEHWAQITSRTVFGLDPDDFVVEAAQ